MAERFLSIREVVNRTSLSKTEIYKRIRAGEFPAQVRLGLRKVAWVESEIDVFMESCMAERAA